MPENKKRFSICSDEELMRLVCAGEVGAFDELYSRYSKALLVYFVRMLNFDKNLANDALQDVFLKIAEDPQKFDRQRSFKTWVFSVASNSCKNFYRHNQVVKNNREQLEYLQETVNEKAFFELANRIDAKHFRRLLDEALDELPIEKKEAFILRYQEDKTISEIAQIQNCPLGSVKSRLHYTLKLLEEKLRIFNPITH